MAEQDFYYNEKVPIKKYQSDVDHTKQTHYNFKVTVRVNREHETMAELDSDSHISLISEHFFEVLKKAGQVEFLEDDPVAFEGLGSRIQFKYSPIMLTVQIGRVELYGHFIVTSALDSSSLLLGTDFAVNNNVSVAP